MIDVPTKVAWATNLFSAPSISLTFEIILCERNSNTFGGISTPLFCAFSINIPNKSKQIECESLPYQSIDSGLFYKKTLNRLKANKNIHFFRNKEDVNTENSYVFNSVPKINSNENDLWQHFGGYEIETDKNIFDDSIINLMDFDCDQKNSVHFFYTLPFSKNKALIETTWLSNMKDPSEKDYDFQIKEYIENILKIKNYKIIYKEKGQIPLFYPSNLNLSLIHI